MDEFLNLPITSLGELTTKPPVEEEEDYSNLPVSNLSSFDFSGAPPLQKEPEFKTKQSMSADPETMEDIRLYMNGRMGVKTGHQSDEDLVETFVNHMRYVNSNEISTIGELRYVTGASEDEKLRIAKAYKRYDELGSMWQTGDVLDGAKDYALSLITAPSTYLGGIVGGKLAGKALTEGVMMAANQALKTGGIAEAKQVIRSAAIANVAKRSVIAGGVDGSLAAFTDSYNQEIDIELGRQEEYSPLRGAIAATTGAVGAGAAAIPEIAALRNVSGLRDIPLGMSLYKTKRAEEAYGTAGPRIKDAVTKLSAKLRTWEDYTKSGKALNPSRDEVEAIVSDFLDVENPNSITRIVIDSGADLDLSDNTRFTEQILDFAGQLPQKSLDEYNEILKPTGFKFGQLIDIVADAQRLGGQNLNKAGRAKLYAKSLGQLAQDAKAASESLLDNPLEEVEASPRTMEYVTSVWRRALVSHPTTSLINVAGWGQVVSGKTAAEMAQAGWLGVVGLGGKLVGKGSPQLAASNALFKNQVFKLRTLIDPYSSKQAWDTIVDAMPTNLKKQVSLNTFGGVNDTGPAAYNVGDNLVTKGLEKYVDAAGAVSLLKFQDSMTKSFSGLWAIDKQLRLRTGKGLDQVISSGEYDLISNEVVKDGVNSLLKDTFSADVTRAAKDDDTTQRMFKTLGRSVESISNAPVLGFIFPFGRFLTNNMAFIHEYGPTGFIHAGSRMFKDQPWTLQEKITRSAVGTLGLSYLALNSMNDKKEGKQWWELEGSDGTTYDARNLAPGSTYLLFGRILGEAISEDGYLNPELVTQIADQLGTASWARNIDTSTDIGKMIEWARSIETPEDASVFASTMNAGLSFLRDGAVPVAAGVAGNFLRPLDPINDVVGMATGSDVALDKKQMEGWDVSTNNLLRYTSNFFAPFLGREQTEEGANVMGPPKRIATEQGDLQDPNPLGTFFGSRSTPPTNNINKLLGIVNLPAYLLDSKTADPEFDMFMNETIFPMLDERASNLMESELFKKSSPQEKFTRVQDMITEAEKDARDLLDKGFIDGSQLANDRRKWSLLPLVDRNEAKEEFNISKEDKDLSQKEMDAMKWYIQQKKAFEERYQQSLKN